MKSGLPVFVSRAACTQCIDAAYCYRCSVVCLCVSVGGHNRDKVSCAKTAYLIEMPLRMWTFVGQRNHVLCGARFPRERAVFFGGEDISQPL